MATLNKKELDALKRWSKKGQGVFKQVYGTMMQRGGQELVTHPEMNKLPREQWKTVAWNSAWLAADAADGKTTQVIT